MRSLCSGVLSLIAVATLTAQQEDGPGDIAYIPTPPKIVEAMLKLAEVKNGDNVYDLGCGDGRIVIAAAREFGSHGVGVDISPERVQEAEENARRAGVSSRVRFIETNLFDADVSDATVVALYLLPALNLRLRPKLLKDLKTGSRIVSHRFDMADWKPDKRTVIDGRDIYVWIVTEQAKRMFGKPR